MEYTKNTPLKLRAKGFKFIYSNEHISTDDAGLHYEVWRKGHIDVTIEHTPGSGYEPVLVWLYSLCYACFRRIGILNFE